MEKQQIKQIALSIIQDGNVSEKVYDWIINNFSKNDMKLFINCLRTALKDKNVVVRYAGTPSDTVKEKITKMFPDKNLVYVRDDNQIGAGVRIEFGDYILDYTVTNMIIKIMKGIRESL